MAQDGPLCFSSRTHWGLSSLPNSQWVQSESGVRRGRVGRGQSGSRCPSVPPAPTLRLCGLYTLFRGLRELGGPLGGGGGDLLGAQLGWPAAALRIFEAPPSSPPQGPPNPGTVTSSDLRPRGPGEPPNPGRFSPWDHRPGRTPKTCYAPYLDSARWRPGPGCAPRLSCILQHGGQKRV